MYTTSIDGANHSTLAEAKEYVEIAPYWNEAISRGGIIQTIFTNDGEAVRQRSLNVVGHNYNRSVDVSGWYDL